jgi:hypothetical protein
MTLIHTTLLDNTLSKLFIMMDTAIIEDNNTFFHWIWIELWGLLKWTKEMRTSLTTCSWINVKNLSFITEPLKMSRAMIPSVVKAGRIE